MKQIVSYIIEKLRIGKNANVEINCLQEKYPNNIAAEYGDAAIEYLWKHNISVSPDDIIAIDINIYYCLTLIIKNDLSEQFNDFEFDELCKINVIDNADKKFRIKEKYASFVDISYKQLNLKDPWRSCYLRNH